MGPPDCTLSKESINDARIVSYSKIEVRAYFTHKLFKDAWGFGCTSKCYGVSSVPT